MLHNHSTTPGDLPETCSGTKTHLTSGIDIHPLLCLCSLQNCGGSVHLSESNQGWVGYHHIIMRKEGLHQSFSACSDEDLWGMISGSQFRLYLNCIQTISISARLLHNLGMQPVKLDGCRSGGLSVTAETLGSCFSLKKTPCSSQHMLIHIWYNISDIWEFQCTGWTIEYIGASIRLSSG